MRAFIQMLATDRKGATAIEYGLIAGLIALVLVGSLRTLGVLIYIEFARVFIALVSIATQP